MSRKRVRVRVRGRVQGVFFRGEARSRAESLGLSGWIRNAPDGSVEAVFEGDAERVESIVDWCRRGPRGAVVESVETAEETPAGETRFEVR
jgi:acylphosphatase